MYKTPRPAADVHDVVRRVTNMNKHSLTIAGEVIAPSGQGFYSGGGMTMIRKSCGD
jgi:hypothetical protein